MSSRPSYSTIYQPYQDKQKHSILKHENYARGISCTTSRYYLLRHLHYRELANPGPRHCGWGQRAGHSDIPPPLFHRAFDNAIMGQSGHEQRKSKGLRSHGSPEIFYTWKMRMEERAVQSGGCVLFLKLAFTTIHHTYQFPDPDIIND